MPLPFATLVAPLDPREFFASYWTRRAVHLPAAGRTFGDVFGWEALNTILNANDLTFPKVKVSGNDHPVPPEKFSTEIAGQRLVNGRKVLDLFQEGASFGITGADSHWAPLRAVVESVYDATLESVHTNVYCSPANTQGFQCHFDLHEVLVLQVEGEKHWRVFEPTVVSPMESWRPADAPGAAVAPYIDVVLKPGDVLYVPRGHWHYAVAQDSTSLHVTVGITCRKGTAFLDWLTGTLLANPPFRENVPLVSTATDGGRLDVPPALTAWIETLTAAVRASLDEPGLAERFCQAVLRDVQPVRQVDVAIQTAGHALPIDALVFERPPGRRHTITAAGDGTSTLTSGDCEIQLEGDDASFLGEIFAADTFTAADIRRWRPDAVADEVAVLLSELIASGLLVARPLVV